MLEPHRPAHQWPWSAPLRAAAIVLVVLLTLTACDVLGNVGASPTEQSTTHPASTPRPTPLPTPPPGAVLLDARDRQFSTSTLQAVANTPTVMYFTNYDELNHGLIIYRNASRDLELFHGDVFTGPGTIVYDIPALPAGDYYFADAVYQSMHGQFIVR
jgi:hypothetical protein